MKEQNNIINGNLLSMPFDKLHLCVKRKINVHFKLFLLIIIIIFFCFTIIIILTIAPQVIFSKQNQVRNLLSDVECNINNNNNKTIIKGT